MTHVQPGASLRFVLSVAYRNMRVAPPPSSSLKLQRDHSRRSSFDQRASVDGGELGYLNNPFQASRHQQQQQQQSYGQVKEEGTENQHPALSPFSLETTERVHLKS